VATHIAINHEKKNYLNILIRLSAFTMPYAPAMVKKKGGAINYW
jgi:hypothetical protein